ncbi:MAG: hypothetical protein ABSF98_25000, partial [Bryobacteraceae bacterium]
PSLPEFPYPWTSGYPQFTPSALCECSANARRATLRSAADALREKRGKLDKRSARERVKFSFGPIAR